jgi:hypothetical protein
MATTRVDMTSAMRYFGRTSLRASTKKIAEANIAAIVKDNTLDTKLN